MASNGKLMVACVFYFKLIYDMLLQSGLVPTLMMRNIVDEESKAPL